MRKTIFSVIIPAYNAERFIERCIDSVSTVKNTEEYEIIVINDGSTDSTQDILDRKAHEIINMQVLHIENNGVSYARNQALSMAEGEFIIFLDADDYLLNMWYETAMEGVHKNCDFVVYDFVKKYEDGKEERVNYHLSNDRAEFEALLLTSDLMNPCWSRIYRKSIIERNHVRFDEAVSIGEDFLFTLEYFQCCKSVSVIHTPYLYKEEMCDSVMHGIDIWKYMRDDSRVMAARLQYMEKYPTAKNNCLADCYFLHFKAVTNLLLNTVSCNNDSKKMINEIVDSSYMKKILDNVNVDSMPFLKKIEYLLINNRYIFALYVYLKLKAKFLFLKKNNS